MFIGDARIKHPLPLRLRSQLIDKELGGSKGYRGQGYTRARLRALYLAKYRSTATGLAQDKAQLVVDHIIGYRIGGLTPRTNDQTNLRVLDSSNNRHLDTMTNFDRNVSAPQRRLRAF